LTVVVVVAADTAGVTSIVVVVVVDEFGEGMTIPDEGKETTPKEVERVGPFGWLRGTNTIPRIPIMTNEIETAHHIFCEVRFLLRECTRPNLVCLR
jgi:hypothetical protein